MPNEMPLISVIVPTYNRLDYLREAIASAVNQTYTNLEIIVSDDCGSENPQPVIDSFQDDRIRLRRNHKNLGMGMNITKGFVEAKGKYVASLNDDDKWGEDFLSTLVQPLEENPDLALAFCDYYIIDQNSSVDWPATQKHSQREKRDLLAPGIHQPFWKIGLVDQSVFMALATLVRAEGVDWEKLSEAGVFWDCYTTYLACRTGRGAYYCPQRLAYYRVHPQSENMVSGSRDAQAKIRKGKAGTFCNRRFMEDENLRAYRSYFQKEWAHANTTLGIGFLRLGQPLEARPYLSRSLKYHKLSLRTLAAFSLSYLPQSVAHSWATVRNPGLFTRFR
ncbi:MAG: glycosyltransferase family 2 protein [Phormidesmis sp.]